MSTPAQIWAHRTLISNLVQRDLKSKYKQSLLGWSWSLIAPLATLAVYSLVFGVFLRAEPPVAGNGTTRNFALYLFCGLVAWNAFINTFNGALGSLDSAGPLLTRVYFPPECPPIAGALSVLYQTITELVILVVVLLFIGNIGWTTLLAPLALVGVSLFGLGMGMIAGLWNVQYRDVAYISAIVMQMLFYGTPVIYPENLVPETAWGWLPIRSIIEANPMTQFVGIMRSVVYGLELPSPRSVAYASIWMVGMLVFGWYAYARQAPRVIEEL